MGLDEKNQKGVRMRSDGKPIELTIELASVFFSIPMFQLVAQQWTNVGIKTKVKVMARQLFSTRRNAMLYDVGVWGAADEIIPVMDPRWFFPYSNGSIQGIGYARWFESAGKRGIHTWATGIVEKAMVADGVKPSAVPTVLRDQTGALDRAFAKLDTIKDHIVFWSSGAKPLELVKSGEVVMSIAYNGRVGAANLAEGENFEYIWEGQVLDQEYLCLVAGAPNRDAAIDFMMHASTPEAQAEQAKYITYGPMRASGIPIIQAGEPWGPGGVDIMPHMPNTPERLKVSIVSDPQWWSDNGAEINERYSAWMGN